MLNEGILLTPQVGFEPTTNRLTADKRDGLSKALDLIQDKNTILIQDLNAIAYFVTSYVLVLKYGAITAS